MHRRISLDGGDWRLKGYVGEEWRWRRAHQPDTRDMTGWLAGRVPGSVHHDLWQAGEIPDPYYGRNSLLVEWVPDRTWVYTRRFPVEPQLRGRRCVLRCEGVDYAAQFFLNGEPLGAHSGMYTPAQFEVGERLRYGEENLLAVVIEPAPHEQPQVGRTSLVRTHKSRMTYGWDFCPRMIHLGLWDAVYLALSGETRIEDVWVRPQLNTELTRADVVVATQLSARQHATVTVETSLTLAGETIAAQRSLVELAPGASQLEQRLTIADPQLWWPNGSGPAPLYQARVRVVAADEPDDTSDSREMSFGLRRIELVPNEAAPPEALPYTFVVNGRKTYVCGWNWVPLDVLYGVERPARLERLLALASRAGVNLLRVWGGGLIEKEQFYDLCDRYGIMVWQEFILSSSGIDNRPADDPAFVERLAGEAERIIPRRRNHPSLVLWCGGNELQDDDGRPLDDRAPALGALRDVVARLDPDRHWLPTSPSGPLFGNSLENIAANPGGLHDVHGPWEYLGLQGHYSLYNQSTSLLHSEFGVEGVANLRTLEACLPPAQRWPPSSANPVWVHTSSWWIKDRTLRDSFGELSDLATMVRASQFLQAEGLRYAVESNRRRKYRNSGSLPWQFNEPYPNAWCTSAVDYFGRPKPAYYAVARAYRPIHLAARFATLAWGGRATFTAQAWLTNAGAVAIDEAWLELALVGAGGEIYDQQAQRVALLANAATPLATLEHPLAQVAEELFILDLRLKDANGASLASARYLFSRAENLAPLLSAPATTLAVRTEDAGAGRRIEVANTGRYAALLVWLEDARDVRAPGYLYADDNYFSLMPGERRAVVVDWSDVPAGQRRLQVGAWNTETVLVE